MPKLNPEILIEMWERASDEEIGISIETNDPKALRWKLLEAKREGELEEHYGNLMTFIPEGQAAVFIVKKSAELPDA